MKTLPLILATGTVFIVSTLAIAGSWTSGRIETPLPGAEQKISSPDQPPHPDLSNILLCDAYGAGGWQLAGMRDNGVPIEYAKKFLDDSYHTNGTSKEVTIALIHALNWIYGHRQLAPEQTREALYNACAQ